MNRIGKMHILSASNSTSEYKLLRNFCTFVQLDMKLFVAAIFVIEKIGNN